MMDIKQTRTGCRDSEETIVKERSVRDVSDAGFAARCVVRYAGFDQERCSSPWSENHIMRSSIVTTTAVGEK